MKKNVFHILGNGKKTNLWFDPWLPLGSLVDQFGVDIIKQSGMGEHYIVDQLIQNGNWDLCPPTSFELTQAWKQIEMQVPSVNEEDEIIWKPNPDGMFSIKSA